MKGLICVVVIMVFLIHPSISLPSYIIHLKDGGKLVVESYWEQEGRIMFHRYGGVVGLQRHLVERIEEPKEIPRELPEAQKDVPLDGQKKEQAVSTTFDRETVTIGALDTEGDEMDWSPYKERKAVLVDRYRKERKTFQKAARNGDKTAKNAAMHRMRRINKALLEMEKEVKEKNKGVLPEWWWQSTTGEDVAVGKKPSTHLKPGMSPFQ